MNRALLIILIPAVLVATAYIIVARRVGLPLEPVRLVAALVAFAAAVVIVRFYLRRRAGRPVR